MQPNTSTAHRSVLAALAVAGVFGLSCGSPTDPQPSPSPTASAPVPGGAVTGRYVLQLNPSAGCGAPRPSFSFTMDAAAGGVTPHAGTQILLTGAPSDLEAELVNENNALRGGLGSLNEGIVTSDGFLLRIKLIASGALLRGADGRGEVRSGTLIGTIGFGRPGDDQNTLGTCVARDHTFTLSAR